MERKGIFGGTFDPIHNGHMYIAYEALYRLELSRLLFMPSGVPPHKRNLNITDGSLRYEMVKAAIGHEKHFQVSDYEIKKEGFSYTYETVEHFKQIEGSNTEWFFITGADCLIDLDSWKNVNRILEACTLVVFNRPGSNREQLIEQKRKIELKFGKEIIFMDLLQLEISSRSIREMIRDGRYAGFFLPDAVYNMINTLGLYK